jgi:hypothetical protein
VKLRRRLRFESFWETRKLVSSREAIAGQLGWTKKLMSWGRRKPRAIEKCDKPSHEPIGVTAESVVICPTVWCTCTGLFGLCVLHGSYERHCMREMFNWRHWGVYLLPDEHLYGQISLKSHDPLGGAPLSVLLASSELPAICSASTEIWSHDIWINLLFVSNK